MGRYATKDTTADYLRLDIRYLRRQDLLRPRGWVTLSWSRNGEVVSSIRILTEFDRINLCYRHQKCGVGSTPKEYPVLLDTTPCNYGGERRWFLCPAFGCRRRVAILYGGGIFACRKCYQLAYESQREQAWELALRKAQAIRMKLGGTANMFEIFPWKPKGMHWRTYERLASQAEEAAAHSWPLSLLKRIGVRL